MIPVLNVTNECTNGNWRIVIVTWCHRRGPVGRGRLQGPWGLALKEGVLASSSESESVVVAQPETDVVLI